MTLNGRWEQSTFESMILTGPKEYEKNVARFPMHFLHGDLRTSIYEGVYRTWKLQFFQAFHVRDFARGSLFN